MFNSLSIKGKLRIYLYSILFFILLIAGLSLFFVINIEKHTEDLYSHPYQVTYSSKAIESDIRDLFVIMLRMTGTTDEDLIISYALENDITESRIESNFVVLKTKYLGNMDDIDDLYDLYKVSAVNRDNVINFMLAGEFQEASDFVNNIGPGNVNALLLSLGEVEQFAIAKANELQLSANRIATLYITLIILISIGVIGLSLAIFIYLIKDLYPPLNKLLATIDSYKKGKEKNVLDLERKDELGTVSNSFNEMLEFIKTREEIAELSLKLENLRDKENLRITLMSIGDGVIATDTKGMITGINPVACHLTGFNASEAIGQSSHNVFRIIHKHTRLNVESPIEIALKTGKTAELANTTVLISKDGKEYDIADSGAPIVDEKGRLYGAVLVFRDYTEKYQQEQFKKEIIKELRSTQNILELSLDSPKDVIIISLDKQYRYLYFNKTHFLDMKNAYKKEVQLGDCVFDYMSSEEERKRIKKNYDIALSGKSHVTLEKYGKFESNYYETKFSPTYDLDGKIVGLTVFAFNVTERVLMENNVLLNENRYRGLVENLDTAVVIHKEDTSILSCNSIAEKLLGISKEKLVGKFAYDKEFKFIKENKEMMLPKETPVNIIKDTMLPIKNMQMGIVHKTKNDIVWVSVNGIPIVDRENKLLEIVISFYDVSETKKNEAALEYQAYNDYLTTLHNRRYFEEKLIELDTEENYPITIVMSDINGLKLINDSFGHSTGDELLVSAAKLLADNCRNGDILSRIGGDEFVIIMPKTEEIVAEKMVANLNKEAKKIMTQSIPLSISFGIRSKNHKEEDIQEVYRGAEDLMYREKLLQIPSMRSSAIETILSTLYEKDKKSEEHSRSVSQLSERLAIANGMNRQEIAEVQTAGILHDIGKIIIPISIINKIGKLTPEEYETIKTHPEIGFRILNSIQDMRKIANIILNHHERWDGKGYPRGIKSTDIPVKSRIITIADSFDAMTSERTYRDTISKEEALQEIIDNAGTQFDPDLVKVFKKHFKEITRE